MSAFIELEALPNQSFSITLEGRRWDLVFKEADGCMVADVTRDDVVVVRGQRLVSGALLLPYAYQEEGNFLVTTDGDALPYFDQFGVTQFLYYLTAAELSEMRGNG